MTPAAVACVEALLDHIDRLESIHLSGLSPLEGQVLNLFTLKTQARAALAARVAMPRSAAWPTRATSIESTARRLVELVTASLAETGGKRV